MTAVAQRSPETALLLLLVRRDFTREDREDVCTLLTSDLCWDRFLGEARDHEVLPLVRRNLERLGFTGVPRAARDEMDRSCRAVAVRNALLARELVHVLRLLAGAGVPAIPIKGVALAETLYGDRTLRLCSDMDVLVPRDRAREALGLLRGLGYAPEFAERFFEALLLRADIEYTLARRERGFEYVVDLHWGIGWSPRQDRHAAEALWADSRRVTRWGVETHAMSPEWELLTLAVHAARHGWRPLKWLVDVHDYCASRALDWPTLRATAERFDWLPALRQTLGACQLLLGTPAPPDVKPVVPERWDPGLTAPSGGAGRGALVPLRVIGRSSERARYLLARLLVPTLAERRLVRLPSSLGLLYYPLRPVRLAGKWGWRALGRMKLASFR